MKGYIHEVWWMMLLKGLALLLFGIAAIVWPDLTLVTLSLIFAAFLFISGVVNIITGIGTIAHRHGWFLKILMGILEVGVGVYLMKSPLVTAAVFILITGAIFIIQGIIALIAAFTDTDDPGARFLAIIIGILGIIAGFLIIRYPATTGLTYVWILGAYGIIAGALEIAGALSFKSVAHNMGEISASKKTSTARR